MNPSDPQSQQSVFTPVNQDAMISRIEAMESDDLEVSYLSIPASSTPGRVMGITHAPPPTPTSDPVPVPPQSAAKPSPAGLSTPSGQAAFILGGPAALVG